MCMSFLLPIRLACASVHLRIGGVGSERFRPAKIVRNRACLQIYPLPLSRAGGRQSGRDWDVALTKMATTGASTEPNRNDREQSNLGN